MEVRRALLTGAGISSDPPASLPLGRTFGDHLCRGCFEAAARVAPGAVDRKGLTAVAALRCNVLARLARCVDRGLVADLLGAFLVDVPNEAHMLAAVHTMTGTLHLTLNLDDGVERAYALLAGSARLPADAPVAFHRALEEWRRLVRPGASLRVVASGFAEADLDHRPLLVRLRGSAADGWHEGLLGSAPRADPDARGLTEEQLAVVQAATEMDHLAVAGVSGADADCRTALLPRLRRGRFSWTAAELDVQLVAQLRRIDPSQPVLRPAIEGVRSTLPGAGLLSRWPGTPRGGASFKELLRRRWAHIPVDGAAEAYARLLDEAGLPAQASAVRGALRRAGGGPDP